MAVVSAGLLAAALIVWGVGTWRYLQAGYSYSITISAPGTAATQDNVPSSSANLVMFPAWRRIAHIALLAIALCGLLLLGLQHHWSAILLAAAAVGVLLLWLHDTRLYGTIASPTPFWLVVGLAAAALLPKALSRGL